MKIQSSALAALLISTTLSLAAHAEPTAEEQAKVQAAKQTMAVDQNVRREDHAQVIADRNKFLADKKAGVDRATLKADRQKLTASRAVRDQAVAKVRADRATLHQARAQETP